MSECRSFVQSFTWLDPFDGTSKLKQTFDRLRMVVYVILFAVLIVYFGIVDSENPINSVTSETQNPFQFPNMTFCISVIMTQFHPNVYFDMQLEPTTSTLYHLNESEVFPMLDTTYYHFWTVETGSIQCVHMYSPSTFISVGINDIWELWLQWNLIKGENYTDEVAANFYQLASVSLGTDDSPEQQLGSSVDWAPASGFSDLAISKSLNISSVTTTVYLTKMTPLFSLPLSNGNCGTFRDGSYSNSNCVEGYFKLRMRVNDFNVVKTNFETRWGLIKRIVADIGSLLSIVSLLTAVAFSFCVTRLTFRGKKTAYIDHYVRDSVLHLLNENASTEMKTTAKP